MSESKGKRPAVLGMLGLILLTVGSVDSIRNLPSTAAFGPTLIFYFLLAGVTFLLPTGLVSAELASTWTEEGGIYTWCKYAFGKKIGLLVIWTQWICNVIWYPALLAFIAGTLAYLFSPELANNNLYMYVGCVGIFWLVTMLNLAGMRISATFGVVCSILGLVFPIIIIIALGMLWYAQGKHLEIAIPNISAILPHLTLLDEYAALTTIILCFSGIELTTAHIIDVANPQKNFPRAFIISIIIILITMILAALAIAMVVPSKELSFVSGIMQAFDYFLRPHQLEWLEPLFVVMIVCGNLGSLNNWVIASSRVLQHAMQEFHVPAFVCYENKNAMPAGLLWLQAGIVTVISLLFLLLPTINGSYWIFTVLAAQIYMIMYIFMFVAALVLRSKYPQKKRLYTMPGGRIGLYLICTIGILSSLFTIGIGFIRPSHVPLSQTIYTLILLTGMVLFFIPPFLIKESTSLRTEI